MSKVKIGGFLHHEHLARVSVMGVPGRLDTAAVVLNTFGQAGINVQFIVQCPDQHGDDHVVLCVDQDELGRALEWVCRIEAELCASAVSSDADVATLGIFGPDFRVRPGIAGTFFTALTSAGIRLQAISTSISTVTVVIAADRLADAVAAIQQTFELPG